ncbi:MAG: hypothetical protein ACOH2N_02615 [Devosia sp.]
MREGYNGLACIIAVGWDTGFSPVDVRTLTPAQAVTSGADIAFSRDRTKSGESAYGTLSPRSQRLAEAYICGLPYELRDDTAICKAKGFRIGESGRRLRASTPHTKETQNKDLLKIRTAVFGEAENRIILDMRRSGAVEANAGRASVQPISANMGNSIDQSAKLQRTYMPVDVAAVLAANSARLVRRQMHGLEQNKFKKLKPGKGRS